jgi:hypothetical protein
MRAPVEDTINTINSKINFSKIYKINENENTDIQNVKSEKIENTEITDNNQQIIDISIFIPMVESCRRYIYTYIFIRIYIYLHIC